MRYQVRQSPVSDHWFVDSDSIERVALFRERQHAERFAAMMNETPYMPAQIEVATVDVHHAKLADLASKYVRSFRDSESTEYDGLFDEMESLLAEMGKLCNAPSRAGERNG